MQIGGAVTYPTTLAAPQLVETSDGIVNSLSEWKSSSRFIKTYTDVAVVSALGTITGILSGAFGVGGGFIMVPVLSAYTGDHQLALGTSLCAMVGPALASLSTHWKLGNVVRHISLPLAIGSACGAYLGTMAAISMTDEQQRWWFATVMIVVSSRNLIMARRNAQ